MSKFLHKLCEHMHNTTAKQGIEEFDDGTFKMYVRKEHAKSFGHNVRSNHQDEIIFIESGKEVTNMPIVEKNFKGRYHRVDRPASTKLTYYVMFKFTEPARAFYENYQEWSIL